MNKKIAIAAVGVVLAIAALTVYFIGGDDETDELVLHGNVDIRQVELPFADSERIAEVLVREGDRVRAGQVLARLETQRLLPRVRQAEARVAAQAEGLRKLRNGTRPEETAQARAAVGAAQAEAVNARSQYERLKGISESSDGRAVSKLDLDAAQAALQISEARVETQRKSLELALAGPREEDIGQAQAQLDGAQAELALLQRQLHDAELVAPTDAVVRSRLMEPGELATPQRPVFSLAVTDPKWVRAYASEGSLGHLRMGMPAQVRIDSFPEAPLTGSLGFISSVAEFTPKTVQTEELRTSLVYEVRVFVQDPEDRLRLGMPATVYFDLSDDSAEQPR
ncbi:MAG: HlyD family efflux transporter periplasmic adaptor subunit [Steroidobacter sp.]